MNANILRTKFLDFFKAKKHKIVESDSLVPKDDPTVLFTPAGMNQFKKAFLGLTFDFTRAATCQRCLRTDDLDKVGKTPGHHTFFEMLGNFSFGDYFKEEAITWAWEFLTQELNLKAETLWISVYKDDAEAYKIWKEKIKVPLEKIIKLTDKENFWPSEAKEKGPNGPCGPCSEIFFDQGSDIGCGRADCTPVSNCGRFVEVWNLVFTQFNRKVGGILEPLPKKNIDTGMGLERLTAVMQGVSSNFETDLFQPIINEIIAGVKRNPNLKIVYAVADHIRAITFAIFDGVLPSNEARGYVVRKLIRKSLLHLKALGINRPFLYKLVPAVAEIMNNPYPELIKRRENIAQIILAEEKNFISTLNSSNTLFKDKFKELFQKADPEKAGKLAFQLYDTYGIPWELTRDWLDRHQVKFSATAFGQELERQKLRSKVQSSMKGEVFEVKNLELAGKATKFLGYQDKSVRTKIIKIIKDNPEVKKVNQGDTARIILEKTVFYPESGGQIGDTGEFIKGKNCFEVQDTQEIDKVIVHIGKVKAGSFKKGDSVLAMINLKQRLSVARNHTATHLLQAALRKVLGQHVQQQGSLVAVDRLRFDFTHFQDIDTEQLARIEELVNSFILNNYPLETQVMSLTQARKSQALAFFGEKYEGKVRVVSVADFSQEFCAGTHLESTGQIGLFKIIQEQSVASGIRRIEAVTADFAYKLLKEKEDILVSVSSVLNVPVKDVTQELEKRLNYEKEIEKQLSLLKTKLVHSTIEELVREAENINGIELITGILDNIDIDLLRKGVDLAKEKKSNCLIALGTNQQGRALLVLGIAESLCQKGLDASSLIRDIAAEIGGSGGGRKDFAQAGGNKPENLSLAFEKLKALLSNLK